MSNLLGARACETRGRYHYQHRSEFCLGPRIVHFLLALRLLSSPTPRALQHTAMAHASGAELMDKITFQAFRALQDDMQQVGTCRQPLEPHLGGGGERISRALRRGHRSAAWGGARRAVPRVPSYGGLARRPKPSEFASSPGRAGTRARAAAIPRLGSHE